VSTPAATLRAVEDASGPLRDRCRDRIVQSCRVSARCRWVATRGFIGIDADFLLVQPRNMPGRDLYARVREERNGMRGIDKENVLAIHVGGHGIGWPSGLGILL
jgi:hypothetical protein